MSSDRTESGGLTEEHTFGGRNTLASGALTRTAALAEQTDSRP
jgi:hypothetical protein